MDGAGCLRCDVRRDAAREGELLEQLLQAHLVAGDLRVDVGVDTIKVVAGHQSGTAMAGAGDVERLLVALRDHAVQVGVEEVESGCGAPVAEQSRLDVVALQWLAEQWVAQEIDLSHGQVVGGPPPRVDVIQAFVGEFRAVALCSGAPRAGHGGPLRWSVLHAIQASSPVRDG